MIARMSQIKPHALICKLQHLLNLTLREEEILQDLCSEEKVLSKGQSLTKRDDTLSLVLTGWACRYKILDDGRRQITSFILPGDFTSIRACLFGVSDFETETLTACNVVKISAHKLINLFKEHPRLAAALTWGAAREGAMMTERVVSLGRRNAKERMAHLFLELQWRLQNVGMQDGQVNEFPITQDIIADCLGLSIVHVNRTLQEMRKEDLLLCRKGHILLKDPQRLGEICSFDSQHLGGKMHPGLVDLYES